MKIRINILCGFAFDELLFCRQQVMASKAEAEKDGIIVPTTVEDYCIMASLNAGQGQSSGEFDSFGDDYNYAEYYDDDNDDGVDVDDYYDELQQ